MSFSTEWKNFRPVFHGVEKLSAIFPQSGKTFGDFSTLWKKVFHTVENPRAAPGRMGSAGFSLLELLAALAGIGLLAALLIGTLPAARAAAAAAACRGNLRQLAAANLAYAADHGRYVAAAADIASNNAVRWHGVRVGSAFDGARGPLAEYLGGGAGSAWVRRCPAFRTDGTGFEAACGGYGYNALGVGSEACLPGTGVKTECGMRPGAVAHPAETVMFADAAYLQGSGTKAKLIEYSFAEPPRFADGSTPWPTIHFRHRGKANVAWADGHVTSETLTRTGARGAAQHLGWFGPNDNTWFDPF